MKLPSRASFTATRLNEHRLLGFGAGGPEQRSERQSATPQVEKAKVAPANNAEVKDATKSTIDKTQGRFSKLLNGLRRKPADKPSANVVKTKEAANQPTTQPKTTVSSPKGKDVSNAASAKPKEATKATPSSAPKSGIQKMLTGINTKAKVARNSVVKTADKVHDAAVDKAADAAAVVAEKAVNTMLAGMGIDTTKLNQLAPNLTQELARHYVKTGGLEQNDAILIVRSELMKNPTMAKNFKLATDVKRGSRGEYNAIRRILKDGVPPSVKAQINANFSVMGYKGYDMLVSSHEQMWGEPAYNHAVEAAMKFGFDAAMAEVSRQTNLPVGLIEKVALDPDHFPLPEKKKN